MTTTTSTTLHAYLPEHRFDGTELEVRLVSKRQWQTLSALTFRLSAEALEMPGAMKSPGRIVGVPRGFLTDFASIPRAARWLTVRDAETAAAAVVHDFCYRTLRPGREVADRIMLDAMKATKVHPVRRALIYAALRAGGWVAYKRQSGGG